MSLAWPQQGDPACSGHPTLLQGRSPFCARQRCRKPWAAVCSWMRPAEHRMPQGLASLNPSKEVIGCSHSCCSCVCRRSGGCGCGFSWKAREWHSVTFRGIASSKFLGTRKHPANGGRTGLRPHGLGCGHRWGWGRFLSGGFEEGLVRMLRSRKWVAFGGII